MEILIATGNPGKVREIAAILNAPELTLLCLADFPGLPRAEERSRTYFENALEKARLAAYHTGLPALADDSGLEVDALQGAPGIISARFAGPEADDKRNIEKLLRLISDIPEEDLQAKFVCVAVLVYQGRAYQAQGAIAGRIIKTPRGQNGFGYDPVFLLPELGLTLAEIDSELKNRISHRARALLRLRPLLFHLAGIKPTS